jgi:hypothetical protein
MLASVGISWSAPTSRDRLRCRGRNFERFAMSMLLILAAASMAVVAASALPVANPALMPLCAALQTVKVGQILPIRTSGIYVTSFEAQVLYDPSQPLCNGDDQPSTWVEFARASRGL